MKYQSGEEIRQGDRVLYAGQPGEIQSCAPEDASADYNEMLHPVSAWHRGPLRAYWESCVTCTW